jgi:hypothetical protein
MSDVTATALKAHKGDGMKAFVDLTLADDSTAADLHNSSK